MYWKKNKKWKKQKETTWWDLDLFRLFYLFIFFSSCKHLCCYGVATPKERKWQRKKKNLVQVEWRSNKVEDTKVDILLFYFFFALIGFYIFVYTIPKYYLPWRKKIRAMQECSKRGEFLKSRKARKWRHAIVEIP